MISRSLFLVLFAVVVVCSAGASATEPPIMQVKVFFEEPSTPRLLQAEGFDLGYIGDGWADVFVRDEDYRRLRAMGYEIEIIHDDVSAFYASRLAETDGMGDYKTLAEIYAYLDAMKAAHPDIITDRISIGQTFEGRDICAMKISDNPGTDEDEPELFFNAAIHSCEVATPEVLLYFMDYMTDNYGVDPEVTDIVDNCEIWLVPVINADGYYHNEVIAPEGGGMWRKNRRDNLDGTFGVDLARNFGYKWAYNNLSSSAVTSAENYRGTEPFSEPEACVFRNFVESRNFVLQVQYHACDGWVGFPWAYDTYIAPDEMLLQLVADSMAYYSGYSSDGGYFCHGDPEDWSYASQMTGSGVLPFIVEIGNYDDGFWPEPARVSELVAENLGSNLVLCRLADHVFSLGPPKMPQLPGTQSVPTSDYTVTWTHDDTKNPAVAYELVEYQNPVKIVDSASSIDNWIPDGIYGDRSFKRVRDNYHSATWSFSPATRIASLQTLNPIYVEEGDTLVFWTDYELADGYAYLHVDVATDGYSFESIEGNISTEYNPVGLNHGHGITGSSGGWVEGKFDLAAFVGQTILVRFTYYDEGETLLGQLYIDDIAIIKNFETETVIGSDLTETEYSFTDKPDGDYYYRVRAKDAQDQWGKFSNIGLVTVGDTSCCENMGKFYNDGNPFSILDLDAMCGYLFRGGDIYDCLEQVDISGPDSDLENCILVPDGVFSILDIDAWLANQYSRFPSCYFDIECP